MRNMIIRRASEEDLMGIFDIYNEEIRTSESTFEMTAYDSLMQRMWFREHDRDKYPVYVADIDGTIGGWSKIAPWSPRPGYSRTAECSVYVHARCRGRRIGVSLLSRLIEHGRQAGIRVLISRVNADGWASIRLHESLGFKFCGSLEGIGEKFGRVIDVSFYQLKLD